MSELEEDVIEVAQDTDELDGVTEEVEDFEDLEDVEEPRPRPTRWIAPAWFLLGIIVGAAAFAIYTRVAPPAAPAAGVAQADEATLRKAARDGMLEAIATLQADSGQPAAESQEPVAVDQSQFNLRAANRTGTDGAKVTIVEFSDFQCPFCERFHQTVEVQLRETYVDTGKADFVYKHSAFLGQESVWAAQAAECAANQGKFWEYHDLLFAKQNGENQGTFVKDNLIGFAKELNLDMTQFEPCLKNDETLARVQADTQEGQQAGVRGTPTFFINGQPLVGAQPLQAFQQVIDQALAQ